MHTWILMQYHFHEQKLCGKFCYIYGDEWQQFHSFSEFLCKFEELLDILDTPKSTLSLRKHWNAGKARRIYKEGSEQRLKQKQELEQRRDSKTAQAFAGKEPGERFYICIKYRDHATWQGEICWDNQKKKMRFRSTLELLMLLTDTVK